VTITSRRAGSRAVPRDASRVDSYLLLVNSAVTASLGLLYWSLAARLLAPSDLSMGTAWTTALVTVSSIGQLNLFAVLPAVLPSAGPASAGLVRRSYAAAFTATVLLAVGYAVVAEDLVTAPLPGGLVVAVVTFAAASALWTAFSLQDSVAAGVRLTWWIPVENAAVSLAKLGLLAAMAPRWGSSAVLVSTVTPLLLAVPVMSLLLRRRLPGATGRAARERGRTDQGAPSLLGVGRLAAGDWAGFVLAQVAGGYLPVLVVTLAGPTPAAAFVAVWAVFAAVDVALGMVVVAMTVHIARDRERIRLLVRQTWTRLVVLAVLGLVVVLVAGHALLGWYAPRYAGSGWPLLTALMVGSLPRTVVQVTVGTARALRRPGVILAIQAVNAALVLAGAFLAIPVWGPLGAAVGWAGAQLVCAVLAVTVQRRLLRPAPDAEHSLTRAAIG